MYKILEDYPSVPIDQVVPNTYNPNVQSDFEMSKLITSIQEFGFIDPITVREVDGHYEIIDGEHRWRAANALKGDRINIVNLGVISDTTAQQLTLLLRLHGQDDDMKLSDLLKRLETQLGRGYIEHVLPYSPERIDVLLNLDKFSFSQYGEFDPTDYWVDFNISVRQADYDKILQEFERIRRVSEFKADMNEDVKRGLILERICALSMNLSIKEQL